MSLELKIACEAWTPIEFWQRRKLRTNFNGKDKHEKDGVRKERLEIRDWFEMDWLRKIGGRPGGVGIKWHGEISAYKV